jgi:hypothetical protein
MNKRIWINAVSIVCVLAFIGSAQAATNNWDNDGADGLWTTAANWSLGVVPAGGDTVGIANGDTVDVNIGGHFPGSLNITLASNSTLEASAVIRMNNATILVESGSGLSSTNSAFWDLDDADITFEDGAVCSIDSWEQKDINTFTFNLGAAGFTTLTPNRFLIGNGSRFGDISNATYTVDMAAYAGGDRTITLVDFISDFETMDNATFQGAGGLNFLNSGDYPNSTIAWNNASESIQVNVVDSHWDAGAADGLWTSAANWRGDLLPGAGGVVHLSNAVTVTSINGWMPFNLTVNLSGGATLTRPDGVIRWSGVTINVASGSGLTGNGFWDLDGADITFDDGAIATMTSWENKGKNTFTFNLGAEGFATLTPTRFFIGGGATTADGTYVVDMSNYTGAVGVIDLVDFTNNFAGVTEESFQAATLIVSNAGSYSGTKIAFDEARAAIVLDVAHAPVIWDGDADDDSWTTATNWNHDSVPVATDDVVVGLGASVSNGQSDFDSLLIESGASVTFSAALNGVFSNKQVTVAGILDLAGVFRPSDSTIDLSGSLGPSVSALDLGEGAILRLTDGAAFSNATLDVVLQDTPTIAFTLSETGFATLQAGELSGSAAWSNVVFNIDISSYTNLAETSFALIDFTNHVASFDGPFTPVITVMRGDSGLNGVLRFATVDSALTLTVGVAGVWDGDAGDGRWTTPLNWSLDNLPVNGDNVTIANGDVVNTTGISALHGANSLPNRAVVTLSGNSVLTNFGDNLIRLNASTLNVGSGSTLVGGFWDLNSGTVNFQDGAAVSIDNWEHKGVNVFGFTLSETGFTTLTPAALRSGNSATWSDVTFNVDISGYNPANGTNVVLMDFLSSDAAYTNTFNPTIHIVGQRHGSLHFDTDSLQLLLNVVPGPPRGMVILLR